MTMTATATPEQNAEFLRRLKNDDEMKARIKSQVQRQMFDRFVQSFVKQSLPSIRTQLKCSTHLPWNFNERNTDDEI